MKIAAGLTAAAERLLRSVPEPLKPLRRIPASSCLRQNSSIKNIRTKDIPAQTKTGRILNPTSSCALADLIFSGVDVAGGAVCQAAGVVKTAAALGAAADTGLFCSKFPRAFSAKARALLISGLSGRSFSDLLKSAMALSYSPFR
ncbi:MAG: hypothetical protein Q7R35_09130 [Elusimicrobiota bacterium]|nr:hypothetical protein [Elusimicrobiota bacterium]